MRRDLLTGRKLREGATEKGPEAALRTAGGGALAGTRLDLEKANAQARRQRRAGMTVEERINDDMGGLIASMPKLLSLLKAKGIDVKPEHQKAVRDAIHMEAERHLLYAQAAKQAGISHKALPQIDKLTIVVALLEREGKLTPDQGAQWESFYAQASDDEIQEGIQKLWRDLGPGKTLRWWHGLVSQVTPAKRTASAAHND